MAETIEHTVSVVFNHDPDYDPDVCALCNGELYTAPARLHIVIKGRGRLCEDCTNAHAGPGWWEMVEALDRFDDALMEASTDARQTLATWFTYGTEQLVDRWENIEIALKPGSLVNLGGGYRQAINAKQTPDTLRSGADIAESNGRREETDALRKLADIFESPEAKTMWFDNA